LWITHILPLSGLTCLQSAITAPLAVSWDSSSYSSDCPDRIPKRQRDGEEIEASTYTIFIDSIFSLPEYCFGILNGETVHNWIGNKISKLYENPTVKETKIIVLSRQLWVSTGKEKTTMREVFLFSQTWYRNSQWWEC